MSATDSQHYRLCCVGAEWLGRWQRGRYRIVAVELVCAGAAHPDIWATDGFASVMIEVKTSRADFFRDAKKFIRGSGGVKYAVGNYRYFLAPAGLVAPEELPPMWGLLEWRDGNITVIREAQYMACGNHGETAILCSIMRREGFKKGIYNYRKKKH